MRITSFLSNDDSKRFGLVPFYYRKTGCDTKISQRDKKSSYPASLYTMNLGALTSSNNSSNDICWNQMSDRIAPSVQHAVKNRFGRQSPGGVGCDIKHNSYERYLNRLKRSNTQISIIRGCDCKK